MSSENIAPKKILSPRFNAVTLPTNNKDELKKSMPRVDQARKSMPVDKFSVFNPRRGNNNEEVIKSPVVKQPRKEEASR